MGYEDLVTRLRGYNPPDRTIDQQRQMAQDFADAALSIEQLQARVAELEAEQLTWLASDDLIAQRAERAEADLAAAQARVAELEQLLTHTGLLAAQDEHNALRHDISRHVSICASQAQELEALRRALHEIAEEWAGAECGMPVTAQEAYAIELVKRMARMASEALGRVGK